MTDDDKGMQKHPLSIEDRNLAQDYIEKAERNIEDAWHALKAGNLRELYLILSIAQQRVNAAREIVALSQLAKKDSE